MTENEPEVYDGQYIAGLEPYETIQPGWSQASNGNQVSDDEVSDNQGPNDQGPDVQGPNDLELTEIHFHWEDFCEAIDNIPTGASCGPDGVPAVLLKMAKIPISRMLSIIFKTSMKKGTIPQILKLAHIIPIHKGGSRGDPSNYRPISLTSHLMKTGERVMRRTIINFLEFNGKWIKNNMVQEVVDPLFLNYFNTKMKYSML